MKIKKQPRTREIEPRSAKEINLQLQSQIDELKKEISTLRKAGHADKNDLDTLTLKFESEKREALDKQKKNLSDLSQAFFFYNHV